MKRGQITIFIVLGIVIVAAIFLALYFKGQVSDELGKAQLAAKAGLPADVATVWDEIYDCAVLTAEEAIMLIGEQGGYMLPLESALEADDS
jgi:hypothetical protein